MGYEIYDKYDIDISDIWLVERSRYFGGEQNDLFAAELLDKLETIIVRESSPNFGPDKDFGDTYYNRQRLRFFEASIKTYTRFALDFFFSLDNCYSYEKSIIITKKQSDYFYWFVLKLRQYDLNLLEIKKYLKYQMRKGFKNSIDNFEAFLMVCLRQYPNLLSENVKLTVTEFIDTIKEQTKKDKQPITEIVSPTQEIISTTVEISSPDLEISSPNETKKADRKPRPNNFFWTEIDSIKKEKQLKYLRENLISNKLIDEIKQVHFDNHFNAKIDALPLINWSEKQYPLIYLLDKLKPFMSSLIYSGRKETISVSQFAPHFSWNGKAIKVGNWEKTKTEGNSCQDKIYKTIDLIISNL